MNPSRGITKTFGANVSGHFIWIILFGGLVIAFADFCLSRSFKEDLALWFEEFLVWDKFSITYLAGDAGAFQETLHGHK
ncbi:hypothetical protein SAMN05216524_10714 [Mucilaginibacter sp. OK098]|nr:hypothetical protein SAMN05216524_10714 [Mucilaginibacter sp. OK098]